MQGRDNTRPFLLIDVIVQRRTVGCNILQGDCQNPTKKPSKEKNSYMKHSRQLKTAQLSIDVYSP